VCVQFGPVGWRKAVIAASSVGKKCPGRLFA
jgi:hypothetical protein